MDAPAPERPSPITARWTDLLRGKVSVAPRNRLADWHLILVRQPGWQSAEDWEEIASHVREIEPRIEPFVFRRDLPHSVARRLAAKRPSLIFSPGSLTAFKPLRGRVYQGRPIGKVEQLRRLAAAGVPVPRTAVLTPDLRLDPAVWGEFVILKPSDLVTASSGLGIQLMRTSRVRFEAQSEYPAGHPGRLGPMLVQQFVNTGDRIAQYRALTLFGEPLYISLIRAVARRVPLDARDEEIERAAVASQIVGERERSLAGDSDLIAVARSAHAAIPEAPLQGCDILRDVDTGALYVLEVNPGGNTWHFSSDHLAAVREASGVEFVQNRRRQFDAMRTAARVLVEKTRAEAE